MKSPLSALTVFIGLLISALAHDHHSYDAIVSTGQKCVPKQASLRSVNKGSYLETFQKHFSSQTSSHDDDLYGQSVPPPVLDISSLIKSGPSSNRVDLVFFSDGYLASEKDKFIEDARRLAEDVSGNQTFNTVRPLLNFWAAFTASNESGVGTGGKAKNTTYGLYRDGTELRGVYYAKPEVARAACDSMGAQCDFPILLGNDPLYGGLGGRFTVITSSLANGPLILRHELGHSIIPVGEEYDGGFAYFGVNAYHNLSEPVPWAHWLTNTSSTAIVHESPKVERSVMPLQDYAWTMLNISKSWSTTFISSGTFDRHLIRFSLSGLPEANDLKVELDGTDLGWVPRKDIGVDRWHYDIYREESLSGGEHSLKFSLLNPEREGEAQLCSAEVLEFGDEEEFIRDSGYYGVFPTYSEKNLTTYRPTNEDCLMRIVTSPNFCKACREGLWYALLGRVKLIDGITEKCHGKEKHVDLSLIPLAQFREIPVEAEESWTISWFKGATIIPEFTNKTTLVVKEREEEMTKYSVRVKFTTTEIRADNRSLTSDETDFNVVNECGM